MKNVSVLIKPASGNCNMRCTYCFYADITENRAVKSYGIMTKKLSDLLVSQVMQEAEQSANFVFQGGEPTLAGLDYFENFTAAVAEHNRKNLPVQYALQTNGLFLNEQWAAFFAEHDFLVGVSMDGTKDIHDMIRKDQESKGTYSRVEKNIELLLKHKVRTNILTVLTAQSARKSQSIYKLYRKKGWNYMQFIPCLDEYSEPRGQNKYSLTPEAYANFLKTVFDLWYADMLQGKGCYIRFFDNILGVCMGIEPESCCQSGRCLAQIVIEADGSAYPCDFYVTDKYRMGNITKESLQSLLNTSVAKEFNATSAWRAEECQTCPYAPYCRGGCRRDRDTNGTLALNYYCSTFKEFFRYTLPRFKELAIMYK